MRRFTKVGTTVLVKLFSPPLRIILEQQSGDAGCHQRGQGASDHSSQTESGEIALTIGSNSSDASQLNPDRYEIGEST